MYSEERSELFCRRQMSADEYVLWSGRPEKKGLFLAGAEIGSLIFLILWTIFASVLFYKGLKGSDFFPFVLISAIFPAVGIILLSVQISGFLKLRNNTEYVITNKRLYRRLGKKAENFSVNLISNYHVAYHRNGNASVIFPGIIESAKIVGRTRKQQVIHYVTLVNIANITQVQQILDRVNAET